MSPQPCRLGTVTALVGQRAEPRHGGAKRPGQDHGAPGGGIQTRTRAVASLPRRHLCARRFALHRVCFSKTWPVRKEHQRASKSGSTEAPHMLGAERRRSPVPRAEAGGRLLAEPGESTTCLRPSPGARNGLRAAAGPRLPSPPPRHPSPFFPSQSLSLSAGLPPSRPFLIIFILAHLGGIYARSVKPHKRPGVTCVLRQRPESLRRRGVQRFQKGPGLCARPPSLPLAAASQFARPPELLRT